MESVDDAIGPSNHSYNEKEQSDSQDAGEHCQPARAGEYPDQVRCWGEGAWSSRYPSVFSDGDGLGAEDNSAASMAAGKEIHSKICLIIANL